MSNWTTLKPSDIVPPDLLKSFELGSDAYKTYLSIVRATIATSKATQALLSPSGPNILKTVVQAIVDVVEGFLQTGKVHVLFIPMGKITPVPISKNLPSSLTDMAEYFGIPQETLTENAPLNAARAYGEGLTGNGGNAGFLQTFIASLMDELDPNRPQYLQENSI